MGWDRSHVHPPGKAGSPQETFWLEGFISVPPDGQGQGGRAGKRELEGLEEQGWKCSLKSSPCPRAGSLRRRAPKAGPASPRGGNIPTASTQTPLHKEKSQSKGFHQKVWSKAMLPISGFKFKALLSLFPKCCFIIIKKNVVIRSHFF